MNLHFSLHDVAPCHLARLEKAEALFELWGVQKVTYLFVPNFHELGPSHEDEAFVAFCQRPRSFEVEWVLHGEIHRERPEHALREPDARTVWLRRHMTAGEGECLALEPAELCDLVERGQRSFEAVFGVRASHFVPPAWLHASSWLEGLAAAQVASTEDHKGIWSVQTGELKASPVVTWATRTWTRLWGSVVVCPILAWRARSQDLLRIAVHPHDFDVPVTVRSIGFVLRQQLRKRLSIHLREL